MEFEKLYPVNGLPWWFSGKKFACQVGEMGSIPGSGRSPGEGNGNPLQYTCLGNPMDRGAWWAKMRGVTKELDMTEQLRDNNPVNISMLLKDVRRLSVKS